MLPTMPLLQTSDATDGSPEPSVGGLLSLLGDLGPDGPDGLLPGGVYALVPQAPPARYPLWARLLPTACGAGRVCHVLTRSDPADFLQRIQSAGWAGAQSAWMAETLRLYAMSDGFSKLLFRKDVVGLTDELAHWGVKPGDSLLVDSADALLSLHDLFLATSQLGKLRHWANQQQSPVLLNFTLYGASAERGALTGLMDHLSGLARLANDEDGPTLTLEYWQSTAGTSAERTLLLQEGTQGYRIRALAVSPTSGSDNPAQPKAPERQAYAPAVHYASSDPVWAHEMQMLMQQPWQTLETVPSMKHAVADGGVLIEVLRFDAHAPLGKLAKDVHALRVALGPQVRIVVAEHRVSMRYPNELMLLRLGADAVIRKDTDLSRWPKLLEGLATQAPRPVPNLDVDTALATAAMPQGRGLVLVPAFLDEIAAAVERGHRLGVPSALAVLKMRPDRAVTDAVAHTEFGRQGDFMSSDGEKLYVLFNACSVTRGPEVLARLFTVDATNYVSGVDWMASQTDMHQCMQDLAKRHEQHPIDVLPQATQTSPSPDEQPLVPDPLLTAAPVNRPDATVASEPAAGAVAAADTPSAEEPPPPDRVDQAPPEQPQEPSSQPSAQSTPSGSTYAVRVTEVLPHQPREDGPDYTRPPWEVDEETAVTEAMAGGLADDVAELGLGRRAITASAADVNALIRRLARPAPNNPEAGKPHRPGGHF